MNIETTREMLIREGHEQCTADLDREFIYKTLKLLNNMPRPIVGIAMGYQAKSLMASQIVPNKGPLGFDIPIIIDPRIGLDQNEIYYDWNRWMERLKAQNEWDSKN